MKKKVLAAVLSLSMVLNTFSVAGATEADFTAGETVEAGAQEENAEDASALFDDGNVIAEEEMPAAAEKPSEDAVQIGEDVWVVFDEVNRTATISGSGKMWNYLDDGRDTTDTHINPFKDKEISKVTINEGVTNIGDYLLTGTSLNEITIPEGVNSIGKYTFEGCRYLTSVILPKTVRQIGEYSFAHCSRLKSFIHQGIIEFIPERAFLWCDLESFDFKGVKEIGDFAFSDVSMALTFDESLEKIGFYAFSGNEVLQSVTLPDSLVEVNGTAFGDCKNLTTITLPNKKLGLSGVFDRCISLQEIELPEKIDYFSLNDCGRLQKVKVNGRKTRIDFWKCPYLNTIEGYECSNAHTYANENEIPFMAIGEGEHEWSAQKVVDKQPTCTETGSKSYHCDICGSTKESEEIQVLGHDWEKTITKQPTYDEDGIMSYYCYRCETSKEEIIPKLSAPALTNVSVEWLSNTSAKIICTSNVAGNLFYTWAEQGSQAPDKVNGNSEWITANVQKNITIAVPSMPVDIYLQLRTNDGKLSDVVKCSLDEASRPAPEPITYKVGDNITATIDGDTLTLRGSGNTYDCAWEDLDDWSNNVWNIKKVEFEGEITGIGAEFFQGFRELKEITFPEGITQLGWDVLAKCYKLECVVFPSTLKEIKCLDSWEMEASLKSLNSVIIPEGVEVIGDAAFIYCSQLTNIQLPSTIKEIGSAAFGSTGITAFNWPEAVKVIPGSVFSGCSNLTEFSVPETVTDIEDRAFYGCTGLTKISIPESVTYFGNDVFRNCRNLTIYGYRDSAAERYANNNNIPFVSADYKVVFKDNGRTIKTDYIMKGENAVPPTLTKDGYTLSWDADYTDIQEDMVINAVWTRNGSDKPQPPIIVYPPETVKYTVTFKDRGKVIKTDKVASGEAADLPYIDRYGYELSWDKDFSKVTSNMTVNAVWTVLKPAKVTSLTAELGKNYITLSWDEAEYAGYYTVFRKKAGEKSFTQIAKTTRVMWNDRYVGNGVEYQYKILAIRNVEGKKYEGQASEIVTVKPGAPEKGRIYTVGDLNYKVMDSAQVRVTGAAKISGEVRIPSTVTISGKVFKVTSIDHKAFYKNENIVTVRVGNYVNYVGKYSFFRCPNLESVKFGSRVQIISTCAFTQCPKLGNVSLPKSVERLGAKVFYQCPKLKTLTIHSSKLEYIGKKGLAVNSKAVIKVPSKKYSAYKKLIADSGKYKNSKIVKF